MYIHKEGYPTLLVTFLFLSILISGSYYFFPDGFYPVIIFCCILYFFIISFFRIPKRTIGSSDLADLLSPCDGKIVVIEDVVEDEYIKDKCKMISVFMSPLNVHANWYPSDGNVVYTKYHEGKYLAAWNPKASTENERSTVAYTTMGKTILLRQIAGALARRIVTYSKPNDSASKGGEMGFIKFGSRVDIYLPLDCEVKVKMGDKVRGKIDVIAKLNLN
ncbi:MAG: phosphatidylserine decarboxylase family protein [Saprospiraceae bacterium]